MILLPFFSFEDLTFENVPLTFRHRSPPLVNDLVPRNMKSLTDEQYEDFFVKGRLQEVGNAWTRAVRGSEALKLALTDYEEYVRVETSKEKV